MSDAAPSEAAGGYLVGAMWWYAAYVLEPARVLKRSGLFPATKPLGDPPQGLPRGGLGPRFSVSLREPLLLDSGGEHDHLVAEFDRMSERYEAYVRPFSTPLFEEALTLLAPLVPVDARLLDAGCGPGRELRQMATMVPAGEVVGVDLAAGMVKTAHQAARAAGLDNTAFVQGDVGALPEIFHGGFDAVYSCLAHHHYPEPLAAAVSILRCLRPGGIYAVIDPGPAWYNDLSAPLARAADPGWIGFHSPRQFLDLLAAAGFARGCWYDLLPGFGLVIGQRSPD